MDTDTVHQLLCTYLRQMMNLYSLKVKLGMSRLLIYDIHHVFGV